MELKKIKKAFCSNYSCKKVLLLHLIGGLLLLGLFLKFWFVVALVNYKPITRIALDRELEHQGGNQVLESRITEMLISDEANKQKLAITQADIDAKVKEIEDQVKPQGQTLDALLAAQGQTRKDLEGQIKLQLIVEKLVGKDISISDKDVSDYFDKNKATYPKGTTIESKKDEIKSLLFRQQLSQKVQPWLEEIKKSAKINYFIKI